MSFLKAMENAIEKVVCLTSLEEARVQLESARMLLREARNLEGYVRACNLLEHVVERSPHGELSAWACIELAKLYYFGWGVEKNHERAGVYGERAYALAQEGLEHCYEIYCMVAILRDSTYDVHKKDGEGKTPLHRAAVSGYSYVVELLILLGADVNEYDDAGCTALDYAYKKFRQRTAALLLKHGAGGTRGWTELCMAALKGDSVQIIKLLSQQVPTNNSLIVGSNKTALHCAAFQADAAVVCLLLRRYPADLFDEKLRTPLYVAARNGHLYGVMVLLAVGSDINAADTKGKTALHVALLHDHKEVALFLLAKGADVNSCCLIKDWESVSSDHIISVTPLHIAAERSDGDIIDLLVQKGAGLEESNDNGMTPLHCAAINGRLAAVKKLLACGARSAARAKKYGNNALHFAALRGHNEVVELLVARDSALVNTFSDTDFSPLHYASMQGHVATVRLLLAKGAEVNAADTSGITPLHCAAEVNHKEVAAVLLEHGAKVNSEDEDGETPLHKIALKGDVETLELLLLHGANSRAVTHDGRTALHFACVWPFYTRPIELLLAQGALVNALDKERRSALHHAAHGGHDFIVEFLLSKGADAHLKDIHGYTASDYAEHAELREKFIFRNGGT